MQFDAQAVAWREKLVEINEDTLQGAESWVRDMKVRRGLGWEKRPRWIAAELILGDPGGSALGSKDGSGSTHKLIWFPQVT